MTTEANDRLVRLANDVTRFRESAVLDDNAADTTENEDARATFRSWADMKRRRADDIEDVLAAHAAHAAQLDAMKAVVTAAEAVVTRWDTPLWKDAEHTGHAIDRLRTALTSRALTTGEPG